MEEELLALNRKIDGDEVCFVVCYLTVLLFNAFVSM